jgi:MIP family channel proteins
MTHPPSLGQRLLAEVVGTMLLVIIGCGSVIANSLSNGALGLVGVALTWGLLVTGLVLGGGSISGAHYNPAVTIGLAVLGKIESRAVLPYIGAQVLGAVIGAAVLSALFGDKVGLSVTQPAAALGITTVKALAIEMILTAMLMLAVSGAALSDAPAPSAPIMIGGVVAACVLMGGPLTACSINPARSFGPALVAGNWTMQWLYWVAPIAGAVLAALTAKAFRGRMLATA